MLLEAVSQRNVIGDTEPFIIACYDSTVAWALGLVEKLNFNHMTRLRCILMGNFILKLVYFLQLFDLSTPLDVIWHF